MSKHIHIHLYRTADADGPAHAPAGSSKGGQFVSSGGNAPGNAAKLHHQKHAAKYRALHEKTGNPDHKAAAAAHGEAGFQHQNYSQASEHGSYWMESKEKQKEHLAKAIQASNAAHAASLKAPLPKAAKPVNRPQHSPMRQANRNLEAQQLKESKKIVKMGQSPGVNLGVRQMQAKSDVEQAKLRIAARKTKDVGPAHAPAGSSKGGQFVSSGGATSAKAAAEHHSQKQGEHAEKAQSKKLSESTRQAHEKASYHHGEAANHFEKAAGAPKGHKDHTNNVILGNHHATQARQAAPFTPVPTYFHEGSAEDWKKKVLVHHPDAHISENARGFTARVGGPSRGEEVGSIGPHPKKAGVYRGGYRTELQGTFGKR